MLMPSIFGNDGWNDWMDFSFPDMDRMFYGKPSNVMKMPGMRWILNCRVSRKRM